MVQDSSPSTFPTSCRRADLLSEAAFSFKFCKQVGAASPLDGSELRFADSIEEMEVTNPVLQLIRAARHVHLKHKLVEEQVVHYLLWSTHGFAATL